MKPYLLLAVIGVGLMVTVRISYLRQVEGQKRWVAVRTACLDSLPMPLAIDDQAVRERLRHCPNPNPCPYWNKCANWPWNWAYEHKLVGGFW